MSTRTGRPRQPKQETGFKKPRTVKLAGFNNGSRSEVRDQARGEPMTEAQIKAMHARENADRPRAVKARGQRRSSRSH
jgi:hypothetical protein